MLTWVNPHSSLWESAGEEMEAHADCTASAWWRQELYPGLSDIRPGPSP